MIRQTSDSDVLRIAYQYGVQGLGVEYSSVEANTQPALPVDGDLAFRGAF